MTTIEIVGIVIGIIILILILSAMFGWDVWGLLVDLLEGIADAISDMDFDDIDWD